MRLFIAIWLLLVTGAASARDLFVNNRLGDDLFTGRIERPTGIDGPTYSITRALQVCHAGDRIVIANTGQPYHESISLVGGRHSGFERQPFIVEGHGATLDGRIAVPTELWEHWRDDVWRFRPHRLAHLMLYLGDRPARFHSPEPDGGVPQLEPLEWTLTQGYVWFRAEASKLVDGYPLSMTLYSTGITLYRVHDVVVSDLVVQGFQLDGVNVFDGVRDCRLLAITSRGNGRSGITVANASRAVVDDCLIGDNGRAQLLTEGWSHTRLIDTVLVGNTAPATVRRGGELLVNGQPAGGE